MRHKPACSAATALWSALAAAGGAPAGAWHRALPALALRPAGAGAAAGGAPWAQPPTLQTFASQPAEDEPPVRRGGVHAPPPQQPPAPAPPQQQRRPPPPPGAAPAPREWLLRAEAAYVGSRIDVYALLARAEFAGHWRRLHKGSAVLALTSAPVGDAAADDGAAGLPRGPYLVAHSYGAAVLFDAPRALRERALAACRAVADGAGAGAGGPAEGGGGGAASAASAAPAGPPPAPLQQHAEELAVSVRPGAGPAALSPDGALRLPALDARAALVVAQVLGQSVALDHYAAAVERTLEAFCAMNADMAGADPSLARLDKRALLRLVAENNMLMTEIISRLGVHERFDIAWKDAAAGRLWEALRDELEVEARFRVLDSKLNLIQDNLKYFLEILQARKSDALEWTIIVLIGVEIILSLYELGARVG